MSSVQRALSGPTLSFSLIEEMNTVREELKNVAERIGRTLLKTGQLRVTMVALNPQGSLGNHRADGPITIQVLEGHVDLESNGQSWNLAQGSLVMLESGVEHSVSSAHGAIFLLTVVFPLSPDSQTA